MWLLPEPVPTLPIGLYPIQVEDSDGSRFHHVNAVRDSPELPCLGIPITELLQTTIMMSTS